MGLRPVRRLREIQFTHFVVLADIRSRKDCCLCAGVSYVIIRPLSPFRSKAGSTLAPYSGTRGGRAMETIRLGDVIDDYCTRCRLLTNHSVVAIVGEEVKKVRCRTCNHEHDYRQGKVGQKKTKKLSAYEQVLASVLSGKEKETSAQPAPSAPPPPARRRTRPHSMPRRPLRPR